MKQIILAVVAVSLCGCSAIRREPAVTSLTSLGTKTAYSYKTKSANGFYLDAYDQAAPTEKKQVRNQIVDELMGLIDDEFEEFARSLHADKAYKNVFVKVASIALTGSAPFSSAPIAKALAGIDTGLKGTSEAIDVEAWGNQAPEILINTMRAERAQIAEEINVMKSKSVTEYTLQSAVRDLIRYRNAGFVTSALTALSRQTAENAKNKETSAKQAKIDPEAAARKLTQ